MSFSPHVLGTELKFQVYQTPNVDLTNIPISIYIDDPSNIRLSLHYLNSGTDGVLSADTFMVTFTKTSAWSAVNMQPGIYTIRLAIGLVATTQQELSNGPMEVIQPAAGPLPTS